MAATPRQLLRGIIWAAEWTESVIPTDNLTRDFCNVAAVNFLALFEAIMATGMTRFIVIGAEILAVLSVGLLAAATRRFQRARLIV